MDLSWISSGGIGGVGGAGVGILARYLDLVKRLTPEERAQWDALPFQERRVLRRTVRRGDVVDDPALAPLAVTLSVAERPSVLGSGFALLIGLAFIYCAAWSLTTQVYGMTVLGVLLGTLFLGLLANGRRIRRRLVRAEALNARLLAP